MLHRFQSLTLYIALVVFAADWAVAVAPSFTTILPRGGQRGTEVEATVYGNNLSDAVDVMFHEAGLELLSMEVEDDKAVKVKLSIAADAPLGPQGLRVRTKTGVTNLQLFSVGHLPESEEVEPNNIREEAMAIEAGVTINGVVQNEDVDFFQIELAEGERIAVEVEGLRLGNKLFDPKLRFFSPDGHEILAEDDTFPLLQDAGFVHVATEAGVYSIAVNEASYGGANDYHYRLHVGHFPRPFAATPLGGRPGAETPVRWLGDPLLETTTVTMPESAGGGESYALATAQEDRFSPTGIPFRVVDLDGVLEAEPNNNQDEATPGAVAGAFDGVIGEADDFDYFAFEGKADQTFVFRVWARALGSPLDSVLHVFKPDGSTLGGDDDAAGVDSQLRVTLPEDGRYTLRVMDHLRRGGPTFAYRVEAMPVAPKARTTVLENRPGTLTVAQGNYHFLLVNVSRMDFDAPMAVSLEDLPEGLSFENEILPQGLTQSPVIVSAAADAPIAGSLTRVVATSQSEEVSVVGELDQEIRLVDGRNDTTFHGRQVERLALAVAEPAPYALRLTAPKAPVVHNGYRELTVTAERSEGFTTAIALRFPWLPAGMGGGTATIAENETSATIRLEVRTDAAVGEHKLFVAGTAGGWELCTPWTPVTVEAPWVTFDIPNLETEQGKGLDFPVKVTHNTAFEGEYEIRLLNLPKGVSSEPLVLKTGVEELIFKMSVSEETPKGKFGGITARSTLSREDEPVVHTWGSGELKVFEPLPPELQAATPPPAPEETDDEAAEAATERKTRFPST